MSKYEYTTLKFKVNSIRKIIENYITWKGWVIGKTNEMESASVWKQQHTTI